MKIFLKVREDNVVVGAYIADAAECDSDIVHQEVFFTAGDFELMLAESGKKSLSDYLGLADKYGKYNFKYTDVLIAMTPEEKAQANMTTADAAREFLNNTDYKIIKEAEIIVQENTTDAELLEVIRQRQEARETINNEE